MEVQTIAIVIGVSEYLQSDISPLPAAQADAIHFARAIRNWGIPESNIFLFLNSEAKKQAIESLFTRLFRIRDEFKLIFYFCGHGYRTLENIPKSYLVCHDSYIKDGKCSHSIGLDNLFQKINKFPSVESYIFIDACSLRINKITHPKLEEELQGKKKSLKNLFCLLSSGIEESFEGEYFGYFTESLLRSLCIINKTEGSPSQLLNCLHKEMGARNLPFPEMYNIGHPTLSFLPSTHTLLLQDGLVYRHEFIMRIQDMLILNRKKIVCLIGDHGSGKSTLCRSLASEKLETILLNASPNEFSHLIDCISETSSNRFYCLIILDNIETLSLSQINFLLGFVSNLRVSILFSSQHSLRNLVDEKFYHSMIDLPVPAFSPEEGHLLVQINRPDCSETEAEWIHLFSKGTPLKIKKIASSAKAVAAPAEIEGELKKAISAICSCGMYIDERLFANLFHLDEKTLNFLEEIGLVCSSEEGKVPHVLLYEVAEEEGSVMSKRDVLDYWYQQIEEVPTHVGAAKHLLRALGSFGYEEKADSYAKIALSSLSQKETEYLADLVDSSNIFLPLPQMTEASLFLAESLVERKEFEIAARLLDKNSETRELALHAALCKAQRLWGQGFLEESVLLCSEALHMSQSPSHLVKSSFYRGIAYFLQGNWESAFSDFTMVYENAQSPYYMGQAQCMLGSLLGIRGVDIALGKEHLKSGIRLLMELKDFAGVWTGWNNLGEILWKCGEYKSSIFYLEKALELSNTIRSEGAHLETLRNLLELYLRWKGPFSTQVTDLVTKIEHLNWSLCDAFGKVQILNTLSTVYLFRRNIKQAFILLKSAVGLTSKSKEYHIYSLSNLSLLAKLIGLHEKSKVFFDRAIGLAEEGKNHLAVHQVKNDFECIFER